MVKWKMHHKHNTDRKNAVTWAMQLTTLPCCNTLGVVHTWPPCLYFLVKCRPRSMAQLHHLHTPGWHKHHCYPPLRMMSRLGRYTVLPMLQHCLQRGNNCPHGWRHSLHSLWNRHIRSCRIQSCMREPTQISASRGSILGTEVRYQNKAGHLHEVQYNAEQPQTAEQRGTYNQIVRWIKVILTLGKEANLGGIVENIFQHMKWQVYLHFEIGRRQKVSSELKKCNERKTESKAITCGSQAQSILFVSSTL